MATNNYIGHSTCVIDNLPFRDSGYSSNSSMKELEKSIDAAKFKYVIAVTANKHQKHTWNTLKDYGFKSIVTFNSSHDNNDETLTIWLKINNRIRKTADNTKLRAPGWNCSVIYNSTERYRCNIFLSDKHNDRLINFRRIPKTPIYYKIKIGKIVKQAPLVKMLKAKFNDIWCKLKS